VVTYKRRPILCLEKSGALLREVIVRVRDAHAFSVVAWVLLPDHMHCIWELPNGDTDYSIRLALIKKGFTSKAKSWLNTLDANLSRKKHREGTVWQRRFWEHMIRDERDFSAHCDYIHYNPVKRGLVDAPKDWPHSTFHRFVKEGLYSEDWGAGPITIGEDIGRE
jgi:putative transposase